MPAFTAIPPTDLALLLLVLLAVGCGVVWSIGIGHVLSSRKRVPTLRAGLELADRDELESHDLPRVVVVVPAHNEERGIERMLRSLSAQQGVDLRVVLSLDRCTDRTLEIARATLGDDPRFTIVEITDCPEGWAGKVHAIHAGLERSGLAPDAQHLLFTDADTEFHPRCIAASVALLRERSLGLLSVLSTLTCDTWFERTAQPVAGIELLRQYPLLKVNRPIDAPHHRAFANGQYLLFTADAYRATGGHGAVRDELLEDIALARKVKAEGFGGGLVLGDGVLHCAMYPDWPAFRRGWKRIFTEAANRRADRLAKSARRLLAIGLFFPVAAFAALAVGALGFLRAGGIDPDLLLALLSSGAFGLLAYLAAITLMNRMARAHPVSILTTPLGAWLVAVILFEAAKDLRERRPTEWGGKRYHRDDRSKGEPPVSGRG